MNLRALITLFIAFSLPAFSGELVRNATIVEVTNTNNNSKDFAIFVEGGTGVCNTSSVYKIIFPEAKFQSQSSDSYSQTFSIALGALVSGKTVRIHNFEDDDCKGANYIAISR